MKKLWQKRLFQNILICILMGIGSFAAKAKTDEFQTPVRISAYAIASEGEFVYIAGEAVNLKGQLPAGSMDLGGGMKDIWLVKLRSDGTPVFSALIGGSNDDAAFSLAVGQGVVYILGETWSTDFPNAPGNLGESDTVLLAISADGNDILWVRRLGGSDQDSGRALSLHNESLFLTGITWSQDMTTNEAKGDADGFLARLTMNGNLEWLHVFGGKSLDAPYDLEVEGDALWITGQSFSSDFNGTYFGGGDIFAARFDLQGTRQFVGLYGGREEDLAYAIIPGADGSVYLTGGTQSGTFEPSNGSFGGGFDGFLMKIKADGSLESFSYLGGTGTDYAYDLTILSNGDVLAVGETNSPTFPLGYTHNVDTLGGGDAFITRLNSAGEVLSVWVQGSTLEDRAQKLVLTSSALWLAGQFSLGPLPYVLMVLPEQMAGIPFPTPQPAIPTATMAVTATLRVTSTPRLTPPSPATPLPTTTQTATAGNQHTATANAEIILGETPNATVSVTPQAKNAVTQTLNTEYTLAIKDTLSQTAINGVTETVMIGLARTVVTPTLTASQIEETPVSQGGLKSGEISTGWLLGSCLLLLTGLGVAYYLANRKKP
jgi:hypothetical protein